MADDINKKEFHNFRYSHSQANNFLYGAYYILCFLIFVGIKLANPEISLFWYLGLVLLMYLLSFTLPYCGYKLAKYIVSSWYSNDFGDTYSEYRKIERRVLQDMK